MTFLMGEQRWNVVRRSITARIMLSTTDSRQRGKLSTWTRQLLYTLQHCDYVQLNVRFESSCRTRTCSARASRFLRSQGQDASRSSERRQQRSQRDDSRGDCSLGRCV
ncbi:hypothetical protein M404DRAFT_396736 [Pisolithus tinctorius Marx 270]|uniref:Uncharacterized protein n=1 Tax=Pisolithus tinctorius Marx 270 TaxID=870435 RepID=A0A0C3PIA6_PISTI|nr:hypothetical protein M404DRAFT_396736 [Pisolithus tinctorius Marx 270]